MMDEHCINFFPFSPLKTKSADTSHALLILFLLTKDKVRQGLLTVIISILILEMQLDLPLASELSLMFTWKAENDDRTLWKTQDSVFQCDQMSDLKCLPQQR